MLASIAPTLDFAVGMPKPTAVVGSQRDLIELDILWSACHARTQAPADDIVSFLLEDVNEVLNDVGTYGDAAG